MWAYTVDNTDSDFPYRIGTWKFPTMFWVEDSVEVMAWLRNTIAWESYVVDNGNIRFKHQPDAAMFMLKWT